MNKMHEEPRISESALMILGEGKIAYIRQVNGAEVPSLFPQAPKVRAECKLFALCAADGEPMVLTDTREAAVAHAWENKLQTVYVH